LVKLKKRLPDPTAAFLLQANYSDPHQNHGRLAFSLPFPVCEYTWLLLPHPNTAASVLGQTNPGDFHLVLAGFSAKLQTQFVNLGQAGRTNPSAK
jgi:hypothetical protein